MIGNSNESVSRRNVLKSSAALTSAGGVTAALVDITEAKRSDLYLGKRPVVETKLEHRNAPLDRCGTANAISPYTIDPKRNRLFLETLSPETVVSRDIVVLRGRQVFGAGDTVPATTGVLAETDYRRLRAKRLDLRHDIDLPELTVESVNGKRLTVTVDGRSTELRPGEETTIELRAVEVAVPQPDASTTQTRSLTPVFTARYHGGTDVFGSDEAKVFPATPRDDYARRRVGSLVTGMKKGAVHGSKVTPKQFDGDLLVIREEGA